MPSYMLSQGTKDKLAALLGSTEVQAVLRNLSEEFSRAEPQLYELQDNLVPGNGTEVYGKLIAWNPDTGLYEVSSTQEAIKDARLNAWGLKYEWVQCRKIYKWVAGAPSVINEIVTPGAPMYEGIIQAVLTYGAFVTANVTIRGATVPVTAYDRLLLSGDSIAAYTRVIITPDANGHRYTITGATCPV